MKAVEVDKNKLANRRIVRSKKHTRVMDIADGFITMEGKPCSRGWYHEDPRTEGDDKLFLIGAFRSEQQAIDSYKQELDLISDDESSEPCVPIEYSKETPHVFRLEQTEDHDAGWYWWDETGVGLHGPYVHEDSALASLKQYCKQLNPEPAPPAPPVKGVPRPKEPETVNHPSHYNKGMIEVIDFIEDQNLNGNLFNVVKYASRADHKGKPMEDLEKAFWYLDREIKRRKGTLVTTTEKNFAKKFRESNEEWNAVLQSTEVLGLDGSTEVSIRLPDGKIFEGVGKFK